MKSNINGVKRIKDGISFNVGLHTEVGNIYIIGMRVWKGLLMPPATKSGPRYYPSVYAGKDFAEWVYQQLIEAGWDVEYDLNLKEKHLCIDPFVMDIATYTNHFE